MHVCARPSGRHPQQPCYLQPLIRTTQIRETPTDEPDAIEFARLAARTGLWFNSLAEASAAQDILGGVPYARIVYGDGKIVRAVAITRRVVFDTQIERLVTHGG